MERTTSDAEDFEVNETESVNLVCNSAIQTTTDDFVSPGETESANLSFEASLRSPSKGPEAPVSAIKPSSAERQKANARSSALRCISSFNARVNRDRDAERKAYLDTQTFTLHYPKRPSGEHNLRAPSGAFKCDADDYARFPVALLQGQFAGPYRSFTPAELNYLPVSTVLYRTPRIANRRVGDSEALEENVTGTLRLHDEADRELFEEVLNAAEESEASVNGEDIVTEIATEKAGETADVENSKEAERRSDSQLTNLDCAFCTEKCVKFHSDCVSCAICKRLAHFSCFFVTNPALRNHITRYPWQCMECKLCEHCAGNENENLMIVCDRCDRTFHTFCLSLSEIPTGSWICPVCVDESNQVLQTSVVSTTIALASEECEKAKATTKSKGRASSGKSSRKRSSTPRRSKKSTASRPASQATTLDSLITNVVEVSANSTQVRAPVDLGNGIDKATKSGVSLNKATPLPTSCADARASRNSAKSKRTRNVNSTPRSAHCRSSPRKKSTPAKLHEPQRATGKISTVQCSASSEAVARALWDATESRAPLEMNLQRQIEQHFQHLRQSKDPSQTQTHAILTAVRESSQMPLSLTMLNGRADEEVQISKLTPSTYSCSQVDDVANEPQQAEPLDLTVGSSRFAAPFLSSTTSNTSFRFNP